MLLNDSHKTVFCSQTLTIQQKRRFNRSKKPSKHQTYCLKSAIYFNKKVLAVLLCCFSVTIFKKYYINRGNSEIAETGIIKEINNISLLSRHNFSPDSFEGFPVSQESVVF